MNSKEMLFEKYVFESIAILSIFIFSFSLTQSLVIAPAITFVSSGIFISARRNIKKKVSQELFESIPQLIDYVISGVQSGLSLTEALISLHSRGPHIARPFFANFERDIKEGINFEVAIADLQAAFNNASADQFLESLIFAKSLGSSELLNLLRQLAAFTRQDLALRSEISAKQSWVKNSAHISALAPWVLLLLLSAQPSTAESYATSSGILVLVAGASFTAIAYLWMAQLSRLPEPRRVFGGTQ